MILQKTSHTTQAKCLQELIDGPDLHTECWIDPILPKHGKMIFGGHAKVGKALHIDEKVLLKDGSWITVADVQPGQELASIDGQPSFVVAKEWHIHRRLFKILFEDGTSLICADDHLWQVSSNDWSWKTWKIVDTLEAQQLLDKLPRGLFIPQFSGDFGNSEELPLDPYILGALLGDGCLVANTTRMATVDAFIIDSFKAQFNDIYQNNYCDYTIKSSRKLENILTTLEVRGLRAWEKHIPNTYLQSSRENRLALLQGLMDTDGTCSKQGSIEFCTTSPKLARDVAYLIRSLGMGCKVKTRTTKFTYKNVKKSGRLSYRVCILGWTKDECFRLPRKLTLTKNRQTTRSFHRNIKSITEISPGPAVCIEVSHPTGLFIANDFIVTHNSMIMLSIVRALTTGENALACPRFRVSEPAKVLLFEQELGEAGLQRRARTVFADANLQREIRYLSREPDVSFSTDKGFEIIGNEIADNRPNVVVIDPLGKCYTGDENSAQEVALLWQKVDRLLRLGNREQLSIILSHHFGKKVNGDRNREGYDPLDAYNFRGSSKWFDDVDSLITVNRLQNLPLPHQAWRLQTRFELRHDEVPPEMYFTVNRERDLRVRYERDVDPPQNNMSLQPIRRNNNTTDPAARR